jgi:hypothetical protein
MPQLAAGTFVIFDGNSFRLVNIQRQHGFLGLLLYSGQQTHAEIFRGL